MYGNMIELLLLKLTLIRCPPGCHTKLNAIVCQHFILFGILNKSIPDFVSSILFLNRRLQEYEYNLLQAMSSFHNYLGHLSTYLSSNHANHHSLQNFACASSLPIMAILLLRLLHVPIKYRTPLQNLHLNRRS